MKVLGKVLTASALSMILTTSVFGAASQPASELATKLYCDAQAAGNPISEQAAARNAATSLSTGGGVEILINTACDGRSFAEYSASGGGSGAGVASGGAGAGAAGSGLATFAVTSPAVIIGGVVLVAAAVSGGGGGDDTPASP